MSSSTLEVSIIKSLWLCFENIINSLRLHMPRSGVSVCFSSLQTRQNADNNLIPWKVCEKRKKGSNLHLGRRVFGKDDEEWLKLSDKYAWVQMLLKPQMRYHWGWPYQWRREYGKMTTDKREQSKKERIAGNIQTLYVWCFVVFFFSHIGFTTFLRKFNLVALF